LTGQERVLVGVTEFGERENSNQMMPSGRPLRKRGFGRKDIQALVNLECITAYDLGPQRLGDSDRDFSLTDGSWPGEYQVFQFSHGEQKTRVPQENAGHLEAAKTSIRSGCPLHIRSFGTAHDQFAAQKLLVMKFLNRSPCFLDRCHLNERKAFGTLCILMTDDLGILNLAYTIKKLEKIAFRSIE